MDQFIAWHHLWVKTIIFLFPDHVNQTVGVPTAWEWGTFWVSVVWGVFAQWEVQLGCVQWATKEPVGH